MGILNKIFDSFNSYTLNLTFENKFIIRGYRNFSVHPIEEIISLKQPILNELLKWCTFKSYYAEVDDKYINDVVNLFTTVKHKKLYLTISKEVYEHIKRPENEYEFTEVTIRDIDSRIKPTVETQIPLPSNTFVFSSKPFINSAKKYEYVYGKKAPFAEFNMYYPNYNVMHKKHINWYLYFRTELKNGVFLPTDVSYIFLYFYEKINKIEWSNEDDVLQRMLNVWFHYREDYSVLDKYLNHWCFDFIVLNSPKMSILDYVKLIHSKKIEIAPLLKDLLIRTHSFNDEFDLNLYEIELMSTHKVTDSKFYLSNDKALIEQTICDVFTLLNKYLLKKNKKNILNSFSPKETDKKVEAYKGCIYELNPKEYVIKYKNFTSYKPLKDFITGVLKHTENAIRSEHSYRGRLKVVNLAPEYINLIDEYFKRKNSKSIKEAAVTISIDMEKVKILEEENKEIVTILSSEKKDDFPIEENIIQEEIHAEESNDEFDFILSLSDTYKEILKSILNEPKDKNIEEIANRQSLMLNIIIDEINDLSLENIGDLLIDTSSSPLVITEEYISKLSEIL